MRRHGSEVFGALLFAAALAVLAYTFGPWGDGGLDRASGPAADDAYVVRPAPFEAGSIAGRVVLGTAGAATFAATVRPGSDCGGGSIDGTLAGAVVAIVGIREGALPKVAPPRIAIGGACGVEPTTAVALTGAPARIQASPEHRMQAFVSGVRVFDAASAGETSITLGAPGRWRIRCAAGHPGEQAWVSVQPHPYQTVSGPDGSFVLPAVPEGTWMVEVWHPAVGETRKQVDVRGGETAHLDLELR